jgi:type IV pilus assembly protein PilX
MKTFTIRSSVSRRSQRGAVLFVALMLLIVLTLLGLSAAQVVSLQERMASIYRADAITLASAEDLLAAVERRTTTAAAASNVLCEVLYNGSTSPATWLDSPAAAAPRYTVENIGRGAAFISAAGSLEAGLASEIADKNCLFLQVSVHAYDGEQPDMDCGSWGSGSCAPPSAPASHVVLQSLFTP